MTISHLIIDILVAKFDSDWPAHRPEGWTNVAFLLVYMICFSASWGPVPWAMPSEIFPSSLKAKGVALSTCRNWLNNFIIGLSKPFQSPRICVGLLDTNATTFAICSFPCLRFSLQKSYHAQINKERDSLFDPHRLMLICTHAPLVHNTGYGAHG